MIELEKLPGGSAVALQKNWGPRQMFVGGPVGRGKISSLNSPSLPLTNTLSSLKIVSAFSENT